MLGRLPSTPSILALLVAALLGYLAGLHGDHQLTSLTSTLAKDEASNPRQTIFDELTAVETRAVAAYVVSRMPHVKTSMFPLGGADGDYISGTSAVELIAPEKQSALAYVDGRSDERPARYARVTVSRGSAVPPDVMEYKVGPLHGCDVNACDDAYVEAGSPITPLVEPASISFEKRPMDMADTTPLWLAAKEVFAPLKQLLLQSFGPVFDDVFMPGCGTACFSGEAGTSGPSARTRARTESST